MLVLGLIGMGYWGLRAFSASYSATLDEDSIAAEAVYVIDWIPKPGIADSTTDSADCLVIAHDEDGNVIWEGPQDEWGAMLGEAESAYQAGLRNRWLLPSSAVALVGLLIFVIGRRRSAAEGAILSTAGRRVVHVEDRTDHPAGGVKLLRRRFGAN